ncbi:hypothetical protein HU200_056680 [Digitaria exilis]|uniref:C2H2-type domain-containing protein n=1 Tax=Digitaria exilis TaxID=1010633 RepID=A0A835AG25_9POAL|nr:hypothetical protein HU200_056680 [Digitaria exilis]
MNSPKDIKSTNDEIIVSPLHEGLVGTTTLPIMDPSQNQPIIQPISHAPQEPYNMPMNFSSTQPNRTEEPLPPSSLIPPTGPTTFTPISSIPFQARFTENSSTQQQTFSSERNFLTMPVSDYLSFTGHMKLTSMDPPSITSLLQGDPVAVLHAHLNTIEGLDLGPIFENPTQVPREVQVAQEPRNNVESSTMKNGRGSHMYECKICSTKFLSSQALGGHMSYHSKAKKKGS